MPLTFGNLEDPARTVVMDRISDMKRESLATHPRDGVTAATVTVDSPVPFSIRKLWFEPAQARTRDVHSGLAVPKQNWQPAFELVNGIAQEGDAESVTPPRYRSVKNVQGDPEKIQYREGGINIRRQLGGLAAKLRDPRLRFLFSPGLLSPNLAGTTENDPSAPIAWMAWWGRSADYDP